MDKETKFYEFSQNNSGGSFDFNYNTGLTVSVIIEAESPRQANDKAEDLGIYFGGFGDCPCCGDRWYSVDSYDARDCLKDILPKVSGVYSYYEWSDGREYAVHYLDGRLEYYTVKGELWAP